MLPNLVKLSYGGLPPQLHHKIGGKKPLIPPMWISSSPIGEEASSIYYNVFRLTNGVVGRIKQI